MSINIYTRRRRVHRDETRRLRRNTASAACRPRACAALLKSQTETRFDTDWLPPSPLIEPMPSTEKIPCNPSLQCRLLVAVLGTVLAVAAALNNLTWEDTATVLIGMFVTVVCWSKLRVGA